MTAEQARKNGYLIATGLPAVVGGGLGVGGTVDVEAGSNNLAMKAVITAGVGAGSSGTLTLTLSEAAGINNPVVLVSLEDGTGSWSVAAAVKVAQSTLTVIDLVWDNVAVALVNGSTYEINVVVIAK